MALINTPVWLTLAATIFVAAHASALETLPGEPPVVEDKQQALQERAAPTDERLASGRVVAVDRAGSRITLEYRPIPQLFLEGGTRIFHVGDPASLEVVADFLTTDAVRHGTDEALRALEDALARVATYAGAHEAVPVEVRRPRDAVAVTTHPSQMRSQ